MTRMLSSKRPDEGKTSPAGRGLGAKGHHETNGSAAEEAAEWLPAARGRVPFSMPKIHDNGIRGAGMLAAEAHARAAAMEIEVTQIGSALGLHRGDWQVSVDEEAERRLAPRGASGLVDAGVVYLRPSTFDARTQRGRYVLAHELTHLAQARNRSGANRGLATRLAAEAEAADIGAAYAKGAPVTRPTAALGPGPAADNDIDALAKAREETLLASPMRTTMKVRMDQLHFIPERGSRWVPGVDRAKQMLAAAMWHLVGEAAYRPDLVVRFAEHVVTDDLLHRGVKAVGFAGVPEGGRAEPFSLWSSIPAMLVRWLQDKNNKAPPIVLDKERIRVILAGAHAEEAWDLLQSGLPQWYTKRIFVHVMAHHRGLLQAFVDAMQGQSSTAAHDQRRGAAIDALDRATLPGAEVVEAIRKDRRLVDTPVYRALWQLPPLGARMPMGSLEPVGENRKPDETLMIELLRDLEASPGFIAAARKPEGHEARKKILENFAFRMKVKHVDLEGEDQLTDGLAMATKPPLPSNLVSYPALNQQHFEVQAGSDVKFAMQLFFDSLQESAFTLYDYQWNLLRVPEYKIENLAATASSKDATDAPGLSDALGARLDRDSRYAEADRKLAAQSVGELVAELGRPGIGATSLVTANAILRMAGTVITTGFEGLAEHGWERTITFQESGLYVVRGIASPWRVKNAVIQRGPSVAWIPVWVTAPDVIARNRIDAELAPTFERLRALQKELFERTRSISPAEEEALRIEYTELRESVYGDATHVLIPERDSLQRRLEDIRNPKSGAAEPAPGEGEAIQKRLDEIADILKRRDAWRKALGPSASLERPVRITATLVSDKASAPLRLLLEAHERPRDGGKFYYTVFDWTTKKDTSIDATGEGLTREDAIVDATKRLLESDEQYARGHCTVYIPPRDALTDGGVGATRTIRVEKDLKALAMETIQNVTLALSVAIVAAATLTGNPAALTLLVPISVVGAIPSAYRLADRAALGTLRANDLNMWMDVVNVLSAPLGAVRAATALRLIRVPTRSGVALMIFGFGLDGLGYGLMAAQVTTQISEISADPSLSEGQRRAKIMEILGAQLLNAGLSVGGDLVEAGKVGQRKRMAGPAADAPVGPRHDPALERVLKAGTREDIPIYKGTSVRGKELGPQGVAVVPEYDPFGIIEGIHVVAGPNATSADIQAHVDTAKMFLEYRGFWGRLRHMKHHAEALAGRRSDKDPGSAAYASRAMEARAEILKHEALVQKNLEALEDPGLGQARKAEIKAELEGLEKAIASHEKNLDNLDEGLGFVAMEGHGARSPGAFDKNAYKADRTFVMDFFKNVVPHLGDNFEVVEPALGEHAREKGHYNCFAYTVGKKVRVLPGPKGESKFAPVNAIYKDKGFRLAQEGDPSVPGRRVTPETGPFDFGVSPGVTKVVVFGVVSADGTIEFKHAAIQRPDGTWLSKLGDYQVIRHATPYAVSGGAYGRPVAIYEKP